MTNFLHTPSIAAWSPYANSKGLLALGQSSPAVSDSHLGSGSKLSVGSLACDGSSNNISMSLLFLGVSRNCRRNRQCLQ